MSEQGRRLMIMQIRGNVDLCEIFRGQAKAINLPVDAVTRRMMYEVNTDCWLLQLESATFDVVPPGNRIPTIDMLFEKPLFEKQPPKPTPNEQVSPSGSSDA